MKIQTKSICPIFFSLIFTLNLTSHSIMSASTSTKTLHDVWSECDLMWFKPDNVHGSVNSFFDRYQDLFKNVTGEKGLILNIGWLVSPIGCWTGSLSDKIYIPTFKSHSYPVWTYQNLKDLVLTFKSEASARGISNFKIGVWMFGNLNPYNNSYDEYLVQCQDGSIIMLC